MSVGWDTVMRGCRSEIWNSDIELLTMFIPPCVICFELSSCYFFYWRFFPFSLMKQQLKQFVDCKIWIIWFSVWNVLLLEHHSHERWMKCCMKGHIEMYYSLHFKLIFSYVDPTIIGANLFLLTIPARVFFFSYLPVLLNNRCSVTVGFWTRKIFKESWKKKPQMFYTLNKNDITLGI